jgi:hypothetical protein
VSEIKPTLLRLRTSTTAALKEELQYSAHRSMSALADEIIEMGLRVKARERAEAATGDGATRLAGSVR